MERQLGQEIKNLAQREMFLKDNCDGCESKGYSLYAGGVLKPSHSVARLAGMDQTR